MKLDDLAHVLPYTKKVIFVDFNERNIILENTETEIEDVRRRTTEVLLEAGCKYLDKKIETDVMNEHYQYCILFSLILISIHFGE